MKSKIAGMSLLVFFCAAAWAGAAPWFRWQNKYDNTILCAQISPGETWVIVQGPFMDSQCRKKGNPQ